MSKARNATDAPGVEPALNGLSSDELIDLIVRLSRRLGELGTTKTDVTLRVEDADVAHEQSRQHPFIAAFNHVAEQIHQTTCDKGFWDQEKHVRDLLTEARHALGQVRVEAAGYAISDLLERAVGLLQTYAARRNDGELIALMHSELSEGLEAIRKHPSEPSDHIPEFTMLEEEFADVIIRIMDHAKGRHLRVAEALLAKIAFNAGRERMHGKRF